MVTRYRVPVDINIHEKIPCDCGRGYMLPVRIYEEEKTKPKEHIIDIVWQCMACLKKVSLMPSLRM